jgi:hypothetical protein
MNAQLKENFQWVWEKIALTVNTNDSRAFSQLSPSNPSGTTSLTGVMMGIAGSIRPEVSGNVLVMITGTFLNTGGGVVAQLRYGTGTAPTGGAALTGTAFGGSITSVLAGGTEEVPFAIQAILSNLFLGTAYWIDLGVAANGAGTASVKSISLSAIEL